MQRSGWAAAAAATLAWGCFPIELDVSKDGRLLIPRQEGYFAVDTAGGKVAKLAGATGGRPAFARFSPDGRTILAVAQSGGGGMGHSYVFTLVDTATRTAREVFRCDNATYARFSPGGGKIAVTRMADQAVAPLEENMPELHVLDAASGERTKVASNVSNLFRWFPDGRSVLIVRVLGKERVLAGEAEAEFHLGSLVRMDVGTGAATPLAGTVGPKEVFFDVSPDGRRILFVASGAAPGSGRPRPGDKPKLYEFDTLGGKLREVAEGVKYAIYSPDGRRVLVGAGKKEETLTLKVADASLTKFTVLADDAAAHVGSQMQQTEVYPGWVDNRTVYYLARIAAFGTAGRNLGLTLVDADGGGRRFLQPQVDAAADRSVR